jgi:SAM-dependent MidA family methyltransferase
VAARGLTCPRVGLVWLTWREAMRRALYGPGGFYLRGEAPAAHFRTSVHVSGAYAGAVLALLRETDAALGHPSRLDLVDVGAGRGELLTQVLAAAREEPALERRIAPHAIEVAPRPPGCSERIRWSRSLRRPVTGLVIASEWLDNVPLDTVEYGPDGPRVLLVDPATGEERPGPRPRPADLAWLDLWWPPRACGDRAEIGRTRDAAWSALTGRLRGLAIAADYSHLRCGRPRRGTLAGYLDGRLVRPVPDGSRDITAHVALDSCAAAGEAAGAARSLLTTQRAVLRALGLRGGRPPLRLAGQDPHGYLAALQRASEVAELTDPGGLGGFGWLVQAAGIPLPRSLASAGLC